MAWTPRPAQSPSSATAESERESGHGGERERLSVSIISREQMDPKNAIILSFQSYYVSVPLTHRLTFLTLHKSLIKKKKKKWTDSRHV